MSRARFGPAGTVWAATTQHIAVPGREPPVTLAYVDLDDGPRVLAHVADSDAGPPPPGADARIVGVTRHGDPLVEVRR